MKELTRTLVKANLQGSLDSLNKQKGAGDPNEVVQLGATAFIRDAKVELRQPGVTASDSDVGFVPLLSANVEYQLAPRWTALVDFDGLISTQGRAIDAAAKIRYDITDTWFLTAGYRVFEGGVDNGERFAFGWYNFAVVSLGARF